MCKLITICIRYAHNFDSAMTCTKIGNFSIMDSNRYLPFMKSKEPSSSPNCSSFHLCSKRNDAKNRPKSQSGDFCGRCWTKLEPRKILLQIVDIGQILRSSCCSFVLFKIIEINEWNSYSIELKIVRRSRQTIFVGGVGRNSNREKYYFRLSMSAKSCVLPAARLFCLRLSRLMNGILTPSISSSIID